MTPHPPAVCLALVLGLSVLFWAGVALWALRRDKAEAKAKELEFQRTIYTQLAQ